MKIPMLFLLLVVIGPAAAGGALAQQGQGTVRGDGGEDPRLPLVLSDGTRRDVSLTGWDTDQASWTFRSPDDGAVSVPLSRLIRYGAYRLDQSGLTSTMSGVLLVDDSLLIGRVVQVTAERCTVEGRSFRSVIPLPAVRAVLLSAPAEDGLRDRVLQQARIATGTNDRLLLIDGSQQAGTLAPESLAALASPAPAALRLTVGGQPVITPGERVRAVVLSPVLRAPGVTGDGDRSLMWIGLADGSLLCCRSDATLDASGSGVLTLACGVSLTVPVTADLLQAIELLAPAVPATGLLAKQAPLRFRHIPYFGPSVPLVRWQGAPAAIEVAGLRYPNGLLMRSAGRAVYATAGAATLVAAVAVAGPPSPLAWSSGQRGDPVDLAVNPGARFSVSTVGPEGNVVERWRSPVLRPGASPVHLEVDVRGAAAIVLAVDPADAGDVADHAVWLDAVLVPEGG